MVKANRFGHIVMNVRNLEASRDFYCKVLGMEVVAHNEDGRIMFLSLGEQHHDLAIVERATEPAADETHSGMVHMAWNVENFETLHLMVLPLKHPT